MITKIFASLAAVMTAGAVFAADAASIITESSPSPAVTYARDPHDANFIIIKEPLRLTLDSEQQAALQQGISFLVGQLVAANQASNATDPSGDLNALNAAVKALDQKLDLMVGYAGRIYGEVAPFGLKAFETLPSAIIVYTGMEYDKTSLKLLSLGGSGSIGLVMVPMKITRISIKNPNAHPETRISFFENSSWVLIPTVNAGIGVTASTAGQTNNQRVGIGFVWGTLNKSSEFVGGTLGLSSTLAVWQGVNAKLMVLKNPSKPGAINNVIGMIGIEKGQLSAETHFNVSAILDAGSIMSGTADAVGGVIKKISGQVTDADKAQLEIQNKAIESGAAKQ